MTDSIVRLYASLDHAKAAVARLQLWGIAADSITVVTSASQPSANAPASAASTDPVLSAILAQYILRAHAEVYAAKVRAGGTLVIVKPYFGVGVMAERMLDEGGQTIDTGVRILPRDPLPLWDSAAPFSSAFRLPTTIRNADAMSALFFPFRLVTHKVRTPTGLLGLPMLKPARTYLTRDLGRQAPLLTRSLSANAPITSRIGMPLLSGR